MTRPPSGLTARGRRRFTAAAPASARVGSGHGAPAARAHRRPGQPALPRRDDVRRLGQPRSRRVDPDHPRARSTPGSTSSTPPTSTRAGESEEIVGKALARPPRRRRPRHQGPRPDGRRPEPARQLAPLDHRRRSSTRCAGCRPTGSTSTRSTGPSPTPTSTRRLGALTDLVRAGQDPLHRLLDLPALGRSSRRSGSPSGAAASGSSPSSRPTRSSSAAIEEDVLPTCRALRHGRDPLEPARRRLADRPLPQGHDLPEPPRAQRLPQRYDMSLPGNQAQARGGRRARRARRGGRDHADRDVARVPARAPGRHRADHRPADDGAAREPAPGAPSRASTTRCSTGSTRSSRPGTTLNPSDAGWDPPALVNPALRRR